METFVYKNKINFANELPNTDKYIDYFI